MAPPVVGHQEPEQGANRRKSTLAKLTKSFETRGRMKLASILRRAIPASALLFVLGFSLVYAVAWIQLYLQPHPYRVASEWIFENIPQGSVLLGPHWDDRLPLSIPGKDAPRYYVMEGRDAELPLYERDTKEKLNLVLQRTAKADYIIFPTARMADSIPRMPEEYPHSTAYLQLLWSEKLGFTFLKSIKDRPSFLGITFNDDLADESFSVYDHPKVVIFQNTERLSIEDMRERILNAKRYEPLPTMNEILLMDQGGWVATAKIVTPRLRKFFKALVLTFLLCGSFWIAIGSRLRFLPDRGIGISFVGGIILSGALTWVFAALGITPFNKAACVFAGVVVGCMGLLPFVTSAATRARLRGASRGHTVFAVVAILGGVVTVAVTRINFPDLFWSAGEVERFALAFFSRNETIPPEPNWSPAGAQGSFYFGHLLAGWLARVVGVWGSLAYEVCFLILGGAVGGAIYSLAAVLLRRPWYALVITLAATVPAIRGAHVLFNGYSSVETAHAEVGLDPNERRLVEWLAESIPGAPMVVEACDGGATPRVALRAGLPRFREESSEGNSPHAQGRAEAVRSACSLADPQGAYRAMMSYGVGLIVISGNTTPERQAALARFAERGDLYAPIYSEGDSIVLAAAFSEYFPRAYNRVASVE